MKEVKIFLASDHAGFKLKEKVKFYLQKSHEVEDFGTFNSSKKDDYPNFVIPCAEKVAKTKNSFGLVFGGSGQGEAIAANKVNGIRAVAVYSFNKKIIELSKAHNNANVLSLGARFLAEKEAIQIVDLWLRTKFSNEERHKRRLKKISEFENKK